MNPDLVDSIRCVTNAAFHLGDADHTLLHYNDVIMSAIASQINRLTIVYSTVYSDGDQRKHQSAASLAFVRGIHRWIPHTKASNAENFSVWWPHHDSTIDANCNDNYITLCHTKPRVVVVCLVMHMPVLLLSLFGIAYYLMWVICNLGPTAYCDLQLLWNLRLYLYILLSLLCIAYYLMWVIRNLGPTAYRDHTTTMKSAMISAYFTVVMCLCIVYICYAYMVFYACFYSI